MTKTFWSVTYRTWGSDFTSTAWFDSKDAADEFAAHDFRDDPVRHTYRSASSIREAEQLVAETNRPFNPFPF